MRRRVVILSGQSLFAEGVAHRLRQYLQGVEFEILDPRQPDVMARIAAFQPTTVILDSADSECSEFCSLSGLLFAFPKLKIICLDPQGDRARVVSSEQCPVANVRDLVDAIVRSA